MIEKTVITIGRQYGSGGREIGKRLAEKLGFSYYDKELIALAAEKSGLSQEALERVDEKATNPFLYSLTMGAGLRGREILAPYTMPMNDQLFIAQAEVIKDLAEKGGCIIVGRCADSILRDCPNRLSVYIYSDEENRIARIAACNETTPEKARKMMTKTDKQRRTYYNYYSDKQWGATESYHLCVDSGKLGIERTVQLLKTFVELSDKDV